MLPIVSRDLLRVSKLLKNSLGIIEIEKMMPSVISETKKLSWQYMTFH